MLGQQLKSMEAAGIVHRTAYPQVPPKVEYRLTKWVSFGSSGLGTRHPKASKA
jgi:hypothetical protein